METEDPISTRFHALIESLMAKATSEIVKVFAEVLLETRVEISRSWKEIDELKQRLEESEEPREDFKAETEEVLVSHLSPQIVSVSNADSAVDEGDKNDVLMPSDVPAESVDNTQSSVAVEPTALQTTDTSDIDQPTNSPSKTQEDQTSETVVKRKRGRPSKSSTVTEPQNPAAQPESSSDSPLEGVSGVDPQQPSSSVDITLKMSDKKGASVSNVTSTHTLRDRQLLSHHRSCLCCSSDQCSAQEKQPKTSPEASPRVYTCRKCRSTFNEWMQYKSHKCSTVYECNRCGKKFTNLKSLVRHRRNVRPSERPFLYCCYLCGHMFATQCGWNVHKRIHEHSDPGQSAQKDTSRFSQQSMLRKELKAKVEVRLERISDAQLAAALGPPGPSNENSSPSLKTTSQNPGSGDEGSASRVCVSDPSSVSSKETGSQTKPVLCPVSECEIDQIVKQLDDDTEYAVTQTVSGQIQPPMKSTSSKSFTVSTPDSGENEAGSSSGSDELTNGISSLSRKRKMSECNHDVYNGVFPVEKIIRWRNTKGRNEVRVKWMPCSLCGAKWKNTWEPAESFTSYIDGKDEESEN